jgi:hypothetical protein
MQNKSKVNWKKQAEKLKLNKLILRLSDFILGLEPRKGF